MCTLDIDKQYTDTYHKIPLQCDVISSSSLRHRNISSDLDSRKRKRNKDVSIDISKDLFLLEPYPASVLVRSRALRPLLVLSRSSLPLSYLDFSSTVNSLGSTRFFKAHVKALDLESSQPMVLVARDEQSRSLFALEREDRGFYAVCQIGSWVSLEKLQDAVGTSNKSLLKALTRTESSTLGISHVRKRTNSLKLGMNKSGDQKRRLAIEAIQSMVRRSSTLPQTEPHLATKDISPSLTEAEPSLDLKLACSAVDGSSLSQASSSEILKNIRTHYFETLYLSRMSVAYFVKGPLSRARATFHPDTSLKIYDNDYHTFLHTLIMPISLFNKKYKDGISNFILTFDIPDHSGDNMDDFKPKSKKKSIIQCSKIRKNGLYLDETALLKRWWAAHEDEKNDINLEVTKGTNSELTKTRISELRIRETQLQIILILETLTLLALSPLTNEAENDQLNECVKKYKSNKQPNTPGHLFGLIDIYTDRLCIWQSLAFESSKQTQNMVELGQGSVLHAKHAETFLKDFCIDVIVPFFSSRLPDQCASICKKLGVSVITPSKTKSSQSFSTSNALSRPGAATKRSLPLKAHPTLKQILTSDRKRRSVSQSHSKAIALMRSATMPVISSVKKDNNETLSISEATDNNSLEANNVKTLSPNRISEREVCFSEPNLESDLKEIKKAAIEMELRNAISILKKPSRQLIAKATADFAAQRAANFTHSATSKKYFSDKVNKKGVQILATPKSNRNKPIIDMTTKQSSPSENLTSGVLSQKLPSIPQSSPQLHNDFANNESPFCSIQATPFRVSSSKIRKDVLISQTPEARNYQCISPSNVRRSSAQLFGSVSGSIRNKPDNYMDSKDICIKHGVENTSYTRTSLEPGSYKENESQSVNVADSRSIYDGLVWNDDFG